MIVALTFITFVLITLNHVLFLKKDFDAMMPSVLQFLIHVARRNSSVRLGLSNERHHGPIYDIGGLNFRRTTILWNRQRSLVVHVVIATDPTHYYPPGRSVIASLIRYSGCITPTFRNKQILSSAASR